MRLRMIAGPLMIPALLALSAMSLYFGIDAARHDFDLLEAKWNVERWRTNRNRPSPGEWSDTRDALVSSATQLTPDPQSFGTLGYLYGARAEAAVGVPELREPLLRKAIGYFVQQARLRPMSPHVWTSIAWGQHLLGDRGEALWSAFDRAMLYGENEWSTQQILSDIALIHWESLSEERKLRIRQMWTRLAELDDFRYLQLGERAARYEIDLR